MERRVQGSPWRPSLKWLACRRFEARILMGHAHAGKLSYRRPVRRESAGPSGCRRVCPEGVRARESVAGHGRSVDWVCEGRFDAAGVSNPEILGGANREINERARRNCGKVARNATTLRAEFARAIQAVGSRKGSRCIDRDLGPVRLTCVTYDRDVNDPTKLNHHDGSPLGRTARVTARWHNGSR